MSTESLIQKLEARSADKAWNAHYRMGIEVAIAIIRQHEAEQPPSEQETQKLCRSWLPEFGQDHECVGNGIVMDIDEFTEGFDAKVVRVPCPICASEAFSNHIQELLVEGDTEEAGHLSMAAHMARHRLKSNSTEDGA